MSEMIELPTINGIQGAVYDPMKAADEQAYLALLWAMAVRELPYHTGLSVCQHAINGAQIRFPKKVWLYEGVQYIEETQFIHDCYHPQFYARKSATAKIKKL